MLEQLAAIHEQLRSAVARLDGGAIDGRSAARLVEMFTGIERAAAAGRAVAAARVLDTGAWRGSGERSASHWMAARAGTTVRAAATTLETARRLEALPATREAFVSGRLSEDQTIEIASAAAADATAEARLLAAAGQESVARLREECRAVRAAALADEEACERIRAGRYLRRWIDHDGAMRLDARLAPDDGAGLAAVIDTAALKRLNDARRTGEKVSREACAADALVALAEGSVRSVVHIQVDGSALERGHTIAGERCVIPGVGPVPVATARRLATAGTVKVLERRGVDVVRVAHPGRTIPAHVRTALEARDTACVVPGCDVRDGLEVDHIVPFALGGPTKLENLARLCRFHHGQKTHHGWRLGGAPGVWTWTRGARGRSP